MRIFKIFPKGYDPIIASIKSVEDAIENDIKDWTPDLTQKMLNLQNKSIILKVQHRSQLPVGLWHEEIFEDVK